MITVQKPISPKVTELQAVIARLDMLGNTHAKNVRELRAKKLAGQHNINDRERLIEMVLAEQDISTTDDTDTKLTSELLQWEAVDAAKQSQLPKLAAAKREAADSILTGLKPEHDKIMTRLVSALVDAHTANVELFGLRSELKDKEIGWRNGVTTPFPTVQRHRPQAGPR
jgi:hypothetical protein